VEEGGEAMRRLVLLVAVVCALAGGVRGQDQSAPPEPAYQRLAYFVGMWKGEGEQKSTSGGGSDAKFVGTMSCGNFAGGFHVVCNLEGSMGGKAYREMATFGYDAEAKAYTWYDIDNTGMNGLAHGSLENGSWAFVFEMKAGGKPMRVRVVLAEKSPDSFENTAQVSFDSRPWEAMLRATFNRTK
jgi:Protein of unknown function (DUF1579)